ncbi:MAG: hypothetical protein Q9P14_01280 [candidate division KSB1 bacterium]|nr:hypothetical protein [candidate division KSB1 bacterium]MDQ7063941.1 hypothetical protein [candidate division KSB1 bacterium]
MQRCYEYLGCEKCDCVMYGRKEGPPCWEVADTLCNHPAFQLIQKANRSKCRFCIYYKAMDEDSTQ